MDTIETRDVYKIFVKWCKKDPDLLADFIDRKFLQETSQYCNEGRNLCNHLRAIKVMHMVNFLNTAKTLLSSESFRQCLFDFDPPVYKKKYDDLKTKYDDLEVK